MPTPDELCVSANQHVKKKDLDGASKLVEQAIEIESGHILAHEILAGICFLTKDYDRAISIFKRISSLDPKNVSALINAGAVLNKKKDFNEASKILRTALSKDRRNADAYYNLAIAHRGLNQMAMSVSAYKEAIRLSPEMVEAYTNLGNVLLEMKNHSQAILQFRKALEIDPNFAKAQNGLRRAEETSYQAKQSMNPFGRLVDMEEVGRKNKDVEKHLNLTAQQRFDDRDQMHKAAKEAELAAIEFLTQLKEELSPAILDLSRLVTEEKHGRVWAGELNKFQIASRRYHLKLDLLKQKMAVIREHEVEIQKLAVEK